MTTKIHTATFGLGRLGYWHAVNVATRIRGAKLSAVCDTNLDLAQKVAKELEVPFYTANPDDIFQDDSIKAVVIASPTSTHYELLKKAVASDKAIFVEKPITIDLHQALEVRKLVEETNTICQVGFMRRFDPAYAAAKKRIEAGEIGQPIYYRGISRDPQAPHESFVEHSGGIFVDVSLHDFDIARYLMNSEVTAVSAHGSVLKYPFMKKYNDVDQSLTYVEFASGAAGDVESSRNAYYGYDIRAEVIGTEGSIFIGNLRQHDIHVLNKKGATHDIVPNFPERFVDAYNLELADFFRVVEEQSVPRVTADDGVKALQISFAARESFQTGKKVQLEVQKKTK